MNNSILISYISTEVLNKKTAGSLLKILQTSFIQKNVLLPYGLITMFDCVFLVLETLLKTI